MSASSSTTENPKDDEYSGWQFSETWQIVGLVASWLGALIIVGLFFAHLYYMRQSKLKRDQQSRATRKAQSGTMERWHTMVSVSTVLTFFFYAGFALGISIYKSTPPPPDLPCDAFIKIFASIYHLGKCALYAVFVFRLKVAFGDSKLAYSDKVIYGLVLFVVVYGLGVMPLDAITGKGQYGVIGNGKLQYCNTVLPPALLYFTAFVDLALAGATLYLFTSRLQRVVTQTSGKTSGARIRNLMIKYTVLTGVAVATTVFMLIFIAVFRTGALVVLDVAVNVVCMAFLSSFYNKAFTVLCGGAVKCLEGCCLCCCRTEVKTDMEAMLKVKSYRDVEDSKSNIQSNVSGTTGSGMEPARQAVHDLEADQENDE